MNRLAPAVLAVALGVLVHWVRADAGVVALPPGPYAVGFQSYDRRDITRTFFADVTASGEPETRGAGRPIQTSVWYPAVAGSGSKMVFRDYVALSARQYGPVAHDRAARFAERYLRRIAADVGLTEAQIRSIAATPVRGRRMAQALSGRYPLVVYDAGGHGSSWGNYALCEYLASNGFTVVAIPNTWDWDATRSDGETIQSAEAAARDVEFTLAFARQLPYVDPVAPVLMGYSWGGQGTMRLVRL
ncbi:MAG: hypothetical protein NTZ79_07110 [Proteobacteria bacterium]|nr:hypothetical protein [Pseudomonadota bacterium]